MQRPRASTASRSFAPSTLVSDLVAARIATDADLDLLSDLATAEAERTRPERGGQWHLDHDHDRRVPAVVLADRLHRPDGHVVVGTIDGTVVGYATAYLSPTVDGSLCMIDELVVHPEARAIGVGSEILAAVRTWAIEHQCQAIESQVLPGNRAAKNFFERVGMKTRKMRVSAQLDEG